MSSLTCPENSCFAVILVATIKEDRLGSAGVSLSVECSWLDVLVWKLFLLFIVVADLS
jgi:hypothetical protein